MADHAGTAGVCREVTRSYLDLPVRMIDANELHEELLAAHGPCRNSSIPGQLRGARDLGNAVGTNTAPGTPRRSRIGCARLYTAVRIVEGDGHHPARPGARDGVGEGQRVEASAEQVSKLILELLALQLSQPAVPSTSTSGASALLILVLALIAGFALGSCTALLMELTRRGNKGGQAPR